MVDREDERQRVTIVVPSEDASESRGESGVLLLSPWFGLSTMLVTCGDV